MFEHHQGKQARTMESVMKNTVRTHGNIDKAGPSAQAKTGQNPATKKDPAKGFIPCTREGQKLLWSALDNFEDIFRETNSLLELFCRYIESAAPGGKGKFGAGVFLLVNDVQNKVENSYDLLNEAYELAFKHEGHFEIVELRSTAKS
jgi:hypothetical protein